jgi:tRNA dimethylallyltransferase
LGRGRTLWSEPTAIPMATATAVSVRPRLIALVGPTAAGKSGAALELAERLDGEIVNADSMALYRGMDVGTAKPGPAERARVPHHCLDEWEVTETAAVAAYQALALTAAAAVRDRGRVPILVGGSGLYVRAVVDEIEFPGTDAGVRSRLEDELAVVGPGVLHERLLGRDPAAAAVILPSNGRRIVRALEVIEVSGRPYSVSLASYEPRAGVVQFGLDRPDLDDRITRRVAEMWDAGLVAEVRDLQERGLRSGVTARRALGYQQVLAMFDGGYDDQQARDATTAATRRFARRQRSWFRRDPRIEWVDAATPGLAAALARRTLES